MYAASKAPYCFQQPTLFSHHNYEDLDLPLTYCMVMFLFSQAVYIC
uniref:Uncharacterized protein n=1 Tax=Macaca fascicularis TaxID=9541 RepID=Q2PG12_MACFA|nr:hypothetical protein [Macaca fascicularis]